MLLYSNPQTHIAISSCPMFHFCSCFGVFALFLPTLIYFQCDFTAVWLPIQEMICKLNEERKQTRSVNFVQTVGTNDCFSTEPVIYICFFGGVGAGAGLCMERGWTGWDWGISLNGWGLCNGYL